MTTSRRKRALVVPQKTPAERFLLASVFADYGVLPCVVAKRAGIRDSVAGSPPAWVVRCGEKITAALFPRIDKSAKFEDH